MRSCGFDAPALVAGIEKLLGREFGITDADLAAIRVDAVIRPVKAGALRDSSSFWELGDQILWFRDRIRSSLATRSAKAR
jgi:hypothetical protein